MPVAPQYQPQPVAAASVERPSSVTLAAQLKHAGAALSLLGIVVTWATKSQLTDQIEASSPTLTPDQVESAVTISLWAGIVVGLVAVGLWLWMAAANGAGKSWARVVATVLGALSVLSTLFSLTSGTGVTIAIRCCRSCWLSRSWCCCGVRRPRRTSRRGPHSWSDVSRRRRSPVRRRPGCGSSVRAAARQAKSNSGGNTITTTAAQAA